MIVLNALVVRNVRATVLSAENFFAKFCGAICEIPWHYCTTVNIRVLLLVHGIRSLLYCVGGDVKPCSI